MIEIKKLNYLLVDEYIHFFDEVTFSDNPEWGGCFCVWYHWDDNLEKDRAIQKPEVAEKYKLNYAKKLIMENRLQGYLAFEGDEVIGWCNVNDRVNYVRLNHDNRHDLWEDYTGEKVRSIVCFTVAPSHRNQGVSNKLLNYAVQDAKITGCDYIEGYPDLCSHGYHGQWSQYERLGFKKKSDENGIVARKYFNE